MRLLIVTQKVDENDDVLGFMHGWIAEFAKHCTNVIVICLQEGEHHLPENVKVLSLGKEKKHLRLHHLMRFYRYIWQERGNYDAVFVHMNPEYAILGGILWRLWHKKVLLWYTHKAVNWRLRLGALSATKIFTASKESFRLTSKKVEVVGHGIPVEAFADCPENAPTGRLCLLAVGRNSPSKDFVTAIKAVEELRNDKDLPVVEFKIESDSKYGEMPLIYRNCHIMIHTSRTGSMDKVVLEALASGRIVATSSEAYASLANGELKGVMFHFSPGDYHELAKTIEEIYLSGILKALPSQQGISYVQQNHNLHTLISKIIAYFSG